MNWSSNALHRSLLYFYTLLTCATIVFLSSEFHSQVNKIEAHYSSISAANREVLRPPKHIQSEFEELYPQLTKVDQDLPGVSTGQVDVLLESYRDSIAAGDYVKAEQSLQQLAHGIEDILAQQDLVARKELFRLREIIIRNKEELDLVLANTTIIPADADTVLLEDDKDLYYRLALARRWVEASGQELGRRRSELAEVQKRIVIDDSEKKLYMLEDGHEIYSMPISLGRPQARTRFGEFEILDKLGTVWSVWDIWLPYWMGIYFAGPSENGIHGLPYDNAGNVYWEKSIGKQNVTYGCVMPHDDDMKRLYEWTDVGTPVSIIP